ncbi:lasso peptide biosynthesis B2 protein [Kitasatospora xanthocidica]|uniref:Lasso peptide biosynthesis B2 protein n=1 Tax=Kitasatospora xanthocidica TaxID=83382 RepID=A0A372ZN50_9ACTN|nr:lasso peptide biosynthesis B2 protein [Kitasatospora xanthocidica]RGD56667.1 lasso peptide biosynthesis B2 protein [Kitasatospora xanthocidica]
MSLHAHATRAGRPPWRRRPAALAVIGAARLIERLPPARIRRVMLALRRGARPADRAEALAARQAVVALSMRCAGQGCLQRSIAAALLCRTRGTWPTWRTGVRTAPFRAHAWIEAEGGPVDEPAELAHFHPLITIAPEPRPGW